MILAESSPSVEKVGGPMRERLAGFARTLRDNGFKVGLGETRDALAILTHPVAWRPTSLRSAFRSLFCATHSDWQRFDEIFDAHWLGFHMRRMRTLSGIAAESQTPARRRSDTVTSQGSVGQPDHVERRKEGDGEGVPMAAGGRRARRALKTWQPPISAISPIPPTWREPMRWPSDLRASCGRGWFAASKSAGAGGGSTCGVRSIAMYRMAERPWTSLGGAARSSRCASSFCSTPRAR